MYYLLAQKLRGFEDCNAQTIFRHFVKGKGSVSIQNKHIKIDFKRKAHNPILRNVPWQKLPTQFSGLSDHNLSVNFQ